MVRSIEEVVSVPEPEGPALQRWIDRRSLAWSLRSGHAPKLFFGRCDDSGRLQVYVIGFVLEWRGTTTLMVSDCAAFSGENERGRIEALILQLADHPSASGLPAGIELILWPTCDEKEKPRLLCRREEPGLFFSLPDDCKDADRLSLPFEGDSAFL